ncbi:MAG: glutamine amidotransferase, partial [Pseudomonadota bacterium]
MISNLHVSFAHDLAWWVVLGGTAVALLAVTFFYRRVARQVSKQYLALLLGLRVAAMLALLLCLFRPAITYLHGTIERSTLLVLADSSQSMSVHDFPGQPNRFERVQSVLQQSGGAAARLENEFDTRWYVFDARARRMNKRHKIAEISPNGKGTDLTTSVKDALGEVPAKQVGGVIILTDGIDTTPLAPRPAFAKLGVPFYTVGVGSVLREQENYRDIMIERVEAAREVTVKTTTLIPVLIEALGYPDRVVPVILSEDGKEVARDQLVLDNAVGTQKITLKYTPQAKGDFELSVSIPTDPAERIVENNLASVPVFVSDPKMRVLYLEGVVRSEYREARRVLQLDPNIEVLCLVQVGANVFYQQGSITDVQLSGPPKTYDDLKPFKVIIIGSLDSSVFSTSQMEDIKRFVHDGGALMMLGGAASFGPGGYGGTPIEEVLPVICGSRNIGQERDEFPLTLTPAGQAHPIFAGITEFFVSAKQDRNKAIPNLLGCVRVKSGKPAAEILAINPNRRNQAGPLVAVAVGRYGSGRVMAATIDSTHLWYRPLKGMGENSPYVRYWGQAVRWLAGADEKTHTAGAGVTAYVDKHFYEPGAAPIIRAIVTDPDGQATEHAKVKAAIKQTDGKAASDVQLSFIQGTRNEYEV